MGSGTRLRTEIIIELTRIMIIDANSGFRLLLKLK